MHYSNHIENVLKRIPTWVSRGQLPSTPQQFALVLYSDDWVQYSFDTAWSPPEIWVKTVAPLFPDCVFTLSYIEEGCDFQGCLLLKGECEIVNETTKVTFQSYADREGEHHAWDIYDIDSKLEEANGSI